MSAHAEPTLQPLTGETLTGASTITKDGARLDVAASGFWGGHRLMSECITPMPPRIGNPPSLPHAGNMKTSKSVPTNNAFERSNEAPSPLWFYHSQKVLAMPQLYASKDSPQ